MSELSCRTGLELFLVCLLSVLDLFASDYTGRSHVIDEEFDVSNCLQIHLSSNLSELHLSSSHKHQFLVIT